MIITINKHLTKIQIAGDDKYINHETTIYYLTTASKHKIIRINNK